MKNKAVSKFHLLNLAGLLAVLLFLATGWPVVPALLLLALVYLLLLAAGAAFIQWNFFFKSLNKGTGNRKEIALTFDDGPDQEITPQILEVLKKHRVKGTFFCIGRKLEKGGELLKRIDKAGHLVGNHSYTHAWFFGFSPVKKIVEELNKTTALIGENMGKHPSFFRPPFGVTNPNIGIALKQTGMISVGWSLRSLDTVRNRKEVLKRLKRQTRAGDVVLLHDNRENTPGILDDYLDWLQQKGFQVVGLDKLFKTDAYEKS